jgi:hypothetical protein
MFQNSAEQKSYVKENYPDITDSQINDDHWDLQCDRCGVVRGFQVIKKGVSTHRTGYQTYAIDMSDPYTVHFRCPVCKTYKMWVIFQISGNETVEGEEKYVTRYYKLTSVPAEGIEDIKELPQEPRSLRVAYKQAIRSMDANAYIAAAVMFRRAVQIITRDILKATPGNLGGELSSLVGKKYSGVILTKDFADNGYIIKESGNQGAHPDEDPDLLDFTPQDALDLQNIFMELVAEIFIAPEIQRQAKQDFLKRRKVSLPKSKID